MKKERKPRRLSFVLTTVVAVTATAAAVYYRNQFHQTDDALAHFQETDPNPGVPAELMNQVRNGETLLFRINDETGEAIEYAPVKK